MRCGEGLPQFRRNHSSAAVPLGKGPPVPIIKGARAGLEVEEKRNISPLPGNELRYLCRPTQSLVTTPTPLKYLYVVT
jgi:hypothetical protein